MLWLLAAIIAALLSLFGGGQQTKQPSPAVQAAAVSSVHLDGPDLIGSGLEPGHVYCASFQFTADDPAERGLNVGLSAQAVKPDGSIVFDNTIAEIDPKGVPGSLSAWLRDDCSGAGFWTPVSGPDGTLLKTEGRLP